MGDNGRNGQVATDMIWLDHYKQAIELRQSVLDMYEVSNPGRKKMHVEVPNHQNWWKEAVRKGSEDVKARQKERLLSSIKKTIEALKSEQKVPGFEVRDITDPNHHVVQSKDSRSQTVGVFASRKYEPFEAVSVYCGRYYTSEDFDEHCGNINYHKYAANINWSKCQLVVDSTEIGNEMKELNHCQDFVNARNLGDNVGFLEAVYYDEKGLVLPYVVVITVKAIAAGEEMLVDYGDNYFAQMMGGLYRELADTKNQSIEYQTRAHHWETKHCEHVARTRSSIETAHAMVVKNGAELKLTLQREEDLQRRLSKSEAQVAQLQQLLRQHGVPVPPPPLAPPHQKRLQGGRSQQPSQQKPPHHHQQQQQQGSRDQQQPQQQQPPQPQQEVRIRQQPQRQQSPQQLQQQQQQPPQQQRQQDERRQQQFHTQQGGQLVCGDQWPPQQPQLEGGGSQQQCQLLQQQQQKQGNITRQQQGRHVQQSIHHYQQQQQQDTQQSSRQDQPHQTGSNKAGIGSTQQTAAHQRTCQGNQPQPQPLQGKRQHGVQQPHTQQGSNAPQQQQQQQQQGDELQQENQQQLLQQGDHEQGPGAKRQKLQSIEDTARDPKPSLSYLAVHQLFSTGPTSTQQQKQQQQSPVEVIVLADD